CHELYGFDRADPMTYPDVLSKLDPADLETLTRAVTNAVDQGIPYDIEFRLMLPDGSYRWIASRCTVETGKGRPSLLRGVDIDITQRKLAQEARDNLVAIVESSDDAILSKSLSGVITSWNAGAEKMYGYNAEEMIGQNVSVLNPDGQSGQNGNSLERLQRSGRVDHIETVRVRRDGQLINVSLTVSPIKDYHGATIGAAVIARDITRRRRAEEALRQSEQLFRTMADSAPVLIWIAGTDKLCTYFNLGWLVFTGRTMDQERGHGWVDNVHSADRAQCMARYIAAFDRRESFKMEYRLRRADGVYRWLYDVGTPRFGSDGEFLGYIGSCVDITEGKEANEALRDLSGKFMGAQEKERARLARELHDDLSQSLALLSIQLEAISRDPKVTGMITKRIEKLTLQIQRLSSDVHRISHELHPSKLAQLGLVSALRGFCREFSATHGIKVEFAAKDVPRVMPNDMSLCLYRVAQEALQNVYKHSGASITSVVLEMGTDGICLLVSDNGDGFDIDAPSSKESLGLVSMRERVRSVNGTIKIDSIIGAGTQITVLIPLPDLNA
ncbi:MAG: PAS domain S-box protein, partial [Pyrinomonadaceae bacterium]